MIYIDDEVAVEYDCNDSWLFGRDYCVHILSRKPTLSQEKIDEMIAFSGTSAAPFHFIEVLLSKVEI